LALAFGYVLGYLEINGTGFEVDLGKLFAEMEITCFVSLLQKLQSSQMKYILETI